MTRVFHPGMIVKSTGTVLIVGFVPLVLFAAIILFQQGDRIREESNLAMRNNAERITVQVDDWVDKNVRALETVASLPSVVSMQREEQSKVLAAVKKEYPWMYLVFTIAPTGQNVARSDELPLSDYSDRQYFKDVIARGKDVAWETLIGKSSNKPALVMAVPIKSNGATVGVMAAAMNVEDVSRVVANWKTGKTGFAFLVDEKGKVIAHPREEYVLSQRRLNDHPLVAAYEADNQPHLSTFVENNTESLGYVQGNRFHWAVAVQQASEELFAPQRQTVVIGLWLLAGAAVLVGVFAILASNRMVKPIVELTHVADRMSMGELDAPIKPKGYDELALLAKALERLRKSMSLAMSRIG
ncbi:MAG TPA: cache and HAMP domain-containing protein [Kofleriaceae bacterium]|nr:cache and HAMP domain-containing protein [Kofleriaceae bacterium]